MPSYRYTLRYLLERVSSSPLSQKSLQCIVLEITCPHDITVLLAILKLTAARRIFAGLEYGI